MFSGIGWHGFMDEFYPGAIMTDTEKKDKTSAPVQQQPKAVKPMAVPVEVPRVIFAYGGKAIGCKQMELSVDEERIVAQHMSVVMGGINSKVLSAIIIVIVVIAKVMMCMTAIDAKVKQVSMKRTGDALRVDGQEKKV